MRVSLSFSRSDRNFFCARTEPHLMQLNRFVAGNFSRDTNRDYFTLLEKYYEEEKKKKKKKKKKYTVIIIIIIKRTTTPRTTNIRYM